MSPGWNLRPQCKAKPWQPLYKQIKTTLLETETFCHNILAIIFIKFYTFDKYDRLMCIDGLVQDCGKSSEYALELPQPRAKPLIWHHYDSILYQITV